MSIRVLLAGPNPNSLDLQRVLLDDPPTLSVFKCSLRRSPASLQCGPV